MMNAPAILLIEDDENDSFLMKRAFANARLANPLYVVRDGEEAIAYLSGEGEFANREAWPLPSIILLDLKMPRKTGFDVLEWLRDQPGLSEIPAVVLTASAQQPDIDKAYALGAKSYLIKPGRLDDLVQMMVRLQGYWLLLSQKPAREEALV